MGQLQDKIVTTRTNEFLRQATISESDKEGQTKTRQKFHNLVCALNRLDFAVTATDTAIVES